jgi:type II secretory pathway component PulJ
MKESRIILIQDLLDQKKRKQKELAFYLEKMEELTRKMQYLQRDIALTEHIIKLIEKDKITEIRK